MSKAKPVLFLKAHVGSYTRSDGTVVQAHETSARSAVPRHRSIVEAATYSGGHHEEHSVSHLPNQSSRGIRVGAGDKAHAMEHARATFSAAGLKRKGTDTISGAEQYESASHAGEIWHNNGTVHVVVQRKSKAAAPAASGGLHHTDLREGDEIEGPDGEKHEYSHTQRGVGRMVVHTGAGHTFPTERDGTLKGFKKTGHNFAD
ncbi:hypothetical protein [Pararobbsia silviterrae]|uniref:Uncharacterized protein n=1 Tax=Pararobbsia silviterrae TaxID=1792498 RepID=A0A494X217_9BURK|nr:hypothetical protein [Pararobbsia silviterrae]RKP44757.1 hypothetical protein D7S86_27450 [Pararobbsia silviterrae]